MGIQPKSDAVKKAIKWISEEKKYNCKKEVEDLARKACAKFDLSPADSDFLFRFVQEEE